MLKTTREQLEKLKALEAQATPGPWRQEHGIYRRNIRSRVDGMHVQVHLNTDQEPGSAEADAAVIAESRNALAALLHDAAVAHRLVDEIQKALARLGDIAPTSKEAVRNKYRDLGLLAALLSAAKGAE